VSKIAERVHVFAAEVEDRNEQVVVRNAIVLQPGPSPQASAAASDHAFVEQRVTIHVHFDHLLQQIAIRRGVPGSDLCAHLRSIAASVLLKVEGFR